jgi:hypothetical protein
MDFFALEIWGGLERGGPQLEGKREIFFFSH